MFGSVEPQPLDLTDPVAVSRDRLTHAPHLDSWDAPAHKESPIHRIHSYPAKFPAFLVEKALAYIDSEGLNAHRIGDVFCGCGTVAYEARRRGLAFWGCDINPVAVLIARAKSGRYNPLQLHRYAERIVEAYAGSSDKVSLSAVAIDRLRYWYAPEQFSNLARLLNAINEAVPARSEYRTPFHCAFSAILKATSQWRQRSTKPSLDPAKQPADVLRAFINQCAEMERAWREPLLRDSPPADIVSANVMTVDPPPSRLQAIISSPPYVTSYEYADLHQLSSLWLGYAADYRDLRRGSIGSTQHELNFRREFSRLNDVGMQVVFGLYAKDPRSARSIAKYYLDMQAVAQRCHDFLAYRGIGVFVIGNTEYSGVTVDNASHFAEALLRAGFKRVRALRRCISNKAHTPHRDTEGRFSRSPTNRQIYAEEYVLMAHR